LRAGKRVLRSWVSMDNEGLFDALLAADGLRCNPSGQDSRFGRGGNMLFKQGAMSDSRLQEFPTKKKVAGPAGRRPRNHFANPSAAFLVPEQGLKPQAVNLRYGRTDPRFVCVGRGLNPPGHAVLAGDKNLPAVPSL